MKKAILTKPLDGDPEGAIREFSEADFERLKRLGAVKEAPKPRNKQAKAPLNKRAKAPRNKSGKAAK